MRNSGKTTRKIDVAVQELFTKGVTYLREKETAMVSARILTARSLRILKQRLYLEHDVSELEAIWDDELQAFRICINK